MGQPRCVLFPYGLCLSNCLFSLFDQSPLRPVVPKAAEPVHNVIGRRNVCKRILVESFHAPTWLPHGSINSPGRACRTQRIPPDYRRRVGQPRYRQQALTEREINVLS